MGNYTVELHYESGHVEVKHLTYEHMRGSKHNGQRPIKVVCHWNPSDWFIFKNCHSALHPIKREGVYVRMEGELVDATSVEYKMWRLLND